MPRRWSSLSLITGARLPRNLSTWRHLFVVAMLMNSIPFTLFAIGETHVSSVLAGIINAATPLTTLAVILLAFPEEKPNAERVIGLLVGFLGILVVVGVWEGLGSGEWTGIAACVGAVTCYGIAFPYVRRHLTGLPESGIGLATGQVACGAAVLLPLARRRGSAARSGRARTRSWRCSAWARSAPGSPSLSTTRS